MSDPFLDLFGDDPELARAQAKALADAMRRRKAAGTVATVVGGPFAQAGRQFSAEAGQAGQDLLDAGKFRANQQLQRERMDRYGPSEAAERFVPVPAGGYAVSTKSGQTVPIPKVERPVLTREPAQPKPPDPAKRSLGEYLTPASADMTDSQRNDLLNLLAVPGAQWLDQMAELSAVLDTAGDAPTPEQIANIQRLIATALVKQNKVAGLGALSGEDINILKKAGGSVGELTNWLGQATGLRDLKASVRSAAQRGARDIELAAGTYGAKPVPGKPLDFTQFDTRAAEYKQKWSGKPAAAGAAPVQVKTKEERDALPAGTKYVGPDGQTYTKR